MQYMLLIYGEEKALDQKEREACYEESKRLTHELHAKGQFRAAAPLYPTATAASVRMRDGKRLVTDGPFAETREQLWGYFLVEADSADEAIAICVPNPGRAVGNRGGQAGDRTDRACPNPRKQATTVVFQR